MKHTSKYTEYGLVDVQSIDQSVKVYLKYGTTDNFMHSKMYDDCEHAYLEPQLAETVCLIQKDLKRIYPSYSLIIYDAARPLSIQKKMFDFVQGTSREIYVANPYSMRKGGFHNYGMAVDMAIVDGHGDMLDFGTPYDFFGDVSHVGSELMMVANGQISMAAYTNRSLLYYLTGKRGLMPYKYEWWHYQLYQKEEDKNRFQLLDF